MENFFIQRDFLVKKSIEIQIENQWGNNETRFHLKNFKNWSIVFNDSKHFEPTLIS